MSEHSAENDAPRRTLRGVADALGITPVGTDLDIETGKRVAPERPIPPASPVPDPADYDAPLFARLAARFGISCPAKVGPIPKLHGHTCRCNRLRPHRMPHTCDCGAWFEPRVTTPEEG